MTLQRAINHNGEEQQQFYLASAVYTPISFEKHLLCCQPSQSLLPSSLVLNNLWDKNLHMAVLVPKTSHE